MIIVVRIGEVEVEIDDEVKRPSLDAIESVLTRAVQSAVSAYYATWDDPGDDGGMTFRPLEDDEDEDASTE
jgi:hypothetical protein